MPPTIVTVSDLESLLASLPNLTPNDHSLIERAYHKAQIAHEGQTRKSGEPYFTHCVSVAGILAFLKLDAEAIAAGLLHDVMEDTAISHAELVEEFGLTVADMVKSVTKLTKLAPPQKSNQESNGKQQRVVNREMEYFRQMLLTMEVDVRVVLVKLADRLHNMRTLGYMREEKQKRIAKETLEIFAPLANRLGIWQIKWELEDLCLRYLDNEAYKNIATSIDEQRASRDQYVKDVVAILRDELAIHGIDDATISGRSKHIYSIYKKMKRKELPFEEIYDVRAVRIIVETIPQCYLALGVVHNLWKPIAHEFDDYIASPKDNSYKSLHTAVIDTNGKTIEVQIRTWEMHEHAEYGVAAHWRYKEGGKHDEKLQERLTHLRRMMEFDDDDKDDPTAFMDSMLNEVFQDRVYVYTPKGDLIDFPAGATPIDFAYHIHTEIGNLCRGAKVNGKLEGLNYQLQMGDKVEILTSKRGGPSLDWLNPDLGYARTSRAKGRIRYWFRKLNRDKHLALGREVLEREFRRMGVTDRMSYESVAALFNYDKIEPFLVAVGAGDINAAQIGNRILDAEQDEEKLNDVNALFKVKKFRHSSPTNDDRGVSIQGTGGLLVNLATCCNPAPGDRIIGYTTRGRGVTVHRQDCSNVLSLAKSEKERLIPVSWMQSTEEALYIVPIEIVAYDRPGLLLDVAKVVTNEQVNMSDVGITTQQDIATFYLTMEISSPKQLTRVLNRIETVPSVVEAYRSNQLRKSSSKS